MTKDSQLALIDGKSLTEKDVMSAIDGVLVQLNQTGNIDSATKVLRTLEKFDNATGKAKSYLLWGMNRWWSENNKSEEDFFDYIRDSESGMKVITAIRYINVWEQIDQENIPKKIQARPMRDLVPIAGMLSQGFEPSKKQWEEIDLASNSSDLSDVIRKIKGKKPRKSGMTLQMDKEGSIHLYKDSKKTYVGFLDVEEAKVDPDVAKAIERIVAGAQIIRR